MSPTDNVPSKLVEVEELAQALSDFARERDWEQFHSPKNLVMALTGEIGELAELFQWMSEDDSRDAAKDTRVGPAVREELADILLYLVRLASVLGVDLNAAAEQKLRTNALKYPVPAARGKSTKYTDL